MPKNKYKEILRSKIKGAIEQALAVKNNISHSVVKGEIVEILIKELFAPLLPSDIGAGTGQIIENHNNLCSTQQDIILYDKSILPPVLFENKIGVFPIESVLYTIEVKTTLTAKELRKAHSAATELTKFTFLPGLQDDKGKEKHHPIERPRSVVFGLTSDLKAGRKSEAQRYKEIYGDGYPYIRAICVADKEYWHEANGMWIKHSAQDQYDEILSFIGGVMNTYKRVALSRHNPNLGHYVIDTPEDGEFNTIYSGTETIVKLKCENCSCKAVMYFGNTKISVNTKDGFISNDLCSKCGGSLIAPGGKYEIQDSELIRIGDFEENDIS
ncbi:MAG: hypothetical protein KAI40_09370 [Desulfobacterales bacterium]|nr:hypothetical protein [Desulfobacterales bacterium]